MVFCIVLDQACSSTRIFHAESKQEWSCQRFLHAFVVGALNGPAHQGILGYLEKHTILASLGTQFCHFLNGQSAILCSNSGKRLVGHIGHFGNYCFLLLKLSAIGYLLESSLPVNRPSDSVPVDTPTNRADLIPVLQLIANFDYSLD